MSKTVSTRSTEETEQLGNKIGVSLKGGEVIELTSDLGGGKTTLTRGLVKGVGSKDHVSSPTFTISNVYQAGKLSIHHFDFYRLGTAGLIEYELEDVIGEPDTVTIIEWSDVVAQVLPEERITIHIASDSNEERTITLTYPEKLKYLVEKI